MRTLLAGLFLPERTVHDDSRPHSSAGQPGAAQLHDSQHVWVFSDAKRVQARPEQHGGLPGSTQRVPSSADRCTAQHTVPKARQLPQCNRQPLPAGHSIRASRQRLVLSRCSGPEQQQPAVAATRPPPAADGQQQQRRHLSAGGSAAGELCSDRTTATVSDREQQ